MVSSSAVILNFHPLGYLLDTLHIFILCLISLWLYILITVACFITQNSVFLGESTRKFKGVVFFLAVLPCQHQLGQAGGVLVGTAMLVNF